MIMYDFLLQLFLMGSLATIVYVIATALPRAGESEAKPNRVREWINSLPLHRVDATINSYKDKILRRTKIFVMKADNFISKHLNKDKDSVQK